MMLCLGNVIRAFSCRMNMWKWAVAITLLYSIQCSGLKHLDGGGVCSRNVCDCGCYDWGEQKLTHGGGNVPGSRKESQTIVGMVTTICIADGTPVGCLPMQMHKTVGEFVTKRGSCLPQPIDGSLHRTAAKKGIQTFDCAAQWATGMLWARKIGPGRLTPALAYNLDPCGDIQDLPLLLTQSWICRLRKNYNGIVWGEGGTE